MKADAYNCGHHRAGNANVLRSRILATLIATCFGSGIAIANPTGPQVVNGQVGFGTQGNVLSITNTPGAIINWQSFSINPDEVTRFLQQNAGSSVLNRITGQDPSKILGALQSNGKVFLINPNGIVFGQGAKVDVNGLVASTLNISNQDFLANKMKFGEGDNAGKINNQGAITTPSGGQVYLIAPDVQNSGIITSPRGDVMLAAGRSVQLVDSTNPAVQVVVSAPADQALNLGQIVAQGGKIGIYGALVNQRGIVNANSAVVGENGKIQLKATQDTILETGSRTTATGQGNGGSIEILGQRVGLDGNAEVDASGMTGGGTVLIGGDYHGDNPSVQNAKRTFVGRDTIIRADAGNSGDGGKVIVWSDEVTRAYGTISAKGGANGGNGGFVETSGKQSLDFHSKVDVTATNGKGGTLLLDPASITIMGGTGDSTSDGSGTFTGSAVGTINFADGSPTTVFQSEMQGLAPGTNIVLEATNFIDTSGTFLGSVVTLPNNSSLTMRTRNSSTDISGTRGINLVGADPNLQFVTLGTGSITLQTGTGASPQTADINIGSLKTNGAFISTSSTGLTTITNISTTPGTIGSGGNVSVNSVGTLTLNGAIDVRGQSASSGDVTLVSGADIGQTSNFVYANALKMTAANGIHGATSIDNFNTQVASLNALNTTSGNLLFANYSSAVSIDDIGSVGYGLKQQPATGNLNIATLAGTALTVNSPIIGSSGGVLQIQAGGSLSQTALGPITSSGGNIQIKATTANALLSTASGAVINSGSGPITLQSDKMSLAGTIDAGSGPVQLLANGSSGIHLGTVATDLTASTLELSSAELNGITAAQLRVGNLSSGPIDIKGALNSGAGGALQNISSSLSLQSANTISQQAGATINGGSSVQARGYSVALTEQNGTGVISGSSSTGDFQYTSLNLLTVGSVDGYSGISSFSNIKLASSSGLGINQAGGTPIAGQTLVLDTKGPVLLTSGANSFTGIAADLNQAGTGAGSLNVSTNGNLTVGGLQFGISGITTNNQAISLTSSSGNINVGAGIKAGSANVTLASGAAIVQTGGNIIGNSLNATATGGIGNGTALVTQVSNLSATNSGANTDIKFVNTGALNLQNVTQSTPGSTGVINIDNTGALTTAASNSVSTKAGSIRLSTHSPLTVDGAVTSANGGAITLEAGPTGNANDVLTVSSTGSVSTTGAVLLRAGEAINLIGPVSGGTVTQQPFLNSPGAPPTLAQCTANPTLAGCSTVLPTLTQCIANRTLAGCTAVLPTDAQCAATPSLPGCIVPPPTLDQCLSQPTLPNCSTVLPSLSQCIAAPTTAGCSAVLPTFAQCQALPTTAGCSAVLPSITQCVANPLTLGCNSVLPQLSDCLANFNLPGCTAVLPTVSQCITSPALAGCSTVLPSLTQCIATPTLTGCSVVLPTLTQCLATPTRTGCSLALPTIAQCTATPTLAGCNLVLPSITQCTTTPTLAGCSAVLPSVAQCTTTPTLTGCSAVLPTIAQCTTTPALTGCSAVLPTLAQCTTTPTLAGCSIVLPTLSQCIATPSLPGCSAVLPTAAQCAANPTLSGCTITPPTLAQCTANPALAGCGAVLPTIAQCTTTPALAGCSAVLPTLGQCIATPTLAGCSAVLPTAAQCANNPGLSGCPAVPTVPVVPTVPPTFTQCIATPTLAGCDAVLPTAAQCAAAPALAGCNVVLATISQCASNPSLSGCSTTLPPTLRGAINSAISPLLATINSMNGNSEIPGLSNQVGGRSNTDENQNGNQADGANGAGPKNSGATKDEPAKKMYCN